jgi:hypothetical protein
VHRLKISRGLRFGVACTLAFSALTTGMHARARASTNAGAVPTLVAPVPRLHVKDLGRIAPSAQIRVALALNNRNSDELEALIRATSDRSSPAYGHFLSPRQFEAAFAPTSADYRRVTSTLARAANDQDFR